MQWCAAWCHYAYGLLNDVYFYSLSNSWKTHRRHHYLKRKKFWQIWAIRILGTQGTQKWNTSNLQLSALCNWHQQSPKVYRIKTEKRSKILWRKPLLNVHWTATVWSFCRWLCPCKRESGATLGQENTEPHAFEMARHWVADFWVAHHLGRAPIRLCWRFAIRLLQSTEEAEWRNVSIFKKLFNKKKNSCQ